MTDMSTIASAVSGEKPSMTDCTRSRTSAGTNWTLRVSVNIGEASVVAWVFRRHACHIAVKDGSRPMWYAGLAVEWAWSGWVLPGQPSGLSFGRQTCELVADIYSLALQGGVNIPTRAAQRSN